MLLSAFLIFFIGGILDLNILNTTLKAIPTPKAPIFWGGPITWVGIVVLSIAIYNGDKNPIILTILFLFILAALGGLTLLLMDKFRKNLPKWLYTVNAIIGLIALVLLVYYALHLKKDVTSIYAKQPYSTIQT